jgi:pimeloyl-ACP methyl ester carboxylesterase
MARSVPKAVAAATCLMLCLAAPMPATLAQDEAPVGERYDIGGRSLFMVCLGAADSDLPTVIAESGLGGNSSHFGPLVPLLAAAPFRSCAYDRAGMGQSDPPADGAETGPRPVTLEDGVDDLHALLGAAGIEPPYLLVGWSIGGWYVRAYAARYPDEVAGIVLLDATHPDEVARLSAVLPPARDDEEPRIAAVRQLLANIDTDPPSAPIGWLDLAASGEEARALGDLGDLPLVALGQGGAEVDLGVPGLVLPEPYAARMRTAIQALQGEIASLSTRGEQRTIEGAGHAIQYDDPEAVGQAILDVQAMIATTKAGPGS